MFLLLVSCGSRPVQQPATGIAYAGPAILNLRKDLASKSGAVGTAKHGEKLDVLETRRRFVRVRTPNGIEGWTDANLLLNQAQMDELKQLAATAAKLPSQGSATVYDALNMHAEPSRQSPSFFQIPESGSVEVVAHRVSPRYAPVVPAPVRHTAPKKQNKKEPKRSANAPPMPAPPAVPRNWEEISRPRLTELPDYRPPEAKPVPLDDWSLVRSKDGKAGWVLSRMLMMSIPDEVAQYAEGHRITAYLPLSDVTDKDSGETKHNWLWTTAVAGQLPYEFDSFRVFVWSLKHRRYETAYIERNVKGYYPVETQDAPEGEEKSFSLVMEDKDGQLYKRTYAFSGYRVRMIAKVPYRRVLALAETGAPRSFDPQPPPAPAESGWKQKLREFRKRWFGK